MTGGELLQVDEGERRVRAAVPFEGTAVRQGLAIAHRPIFDLSGDGRVRCFQGKLPEDSDRRLRGSGLRR